MEHNLRKNDLNFLNEVPMTKVNFTVTVITVSEKIYFRAAVRIRMHRVLSLNGPYRCSRRVGLLVIELGR